MHCWTQIQSSRPLLRTPRKMDTEVCSMRKAPDLAPSSIKKKQQQQTFIKEFGEKIVKARTSIAINFYWAVKTHQLL